MLERLFLGRLVWLRDEESLEVISFGLEEELLDLLGGEGFDLALIFDDSSLLELELSTTVLSSNTQPSSTSSISGRLRKSVSGNFSISML